MERIKAEVERHIGKLGHKVYAIVNYRDCRIEPGVQASYRGMVEALQDRCYLGVTRYGLSGALEMDPIGQPDRHVQSTSVGCGAPWHVDTNSALSVG